MRRAAFRPALRRLSPDLQDGEYRLADIVEVLVRAGYTVGSVEIGTGSGTSLTVILVGAGSAGPEGSTVYSGLLPRDS